MDYFESIVCTLLEAEGYWVRQSFKVNVSKEDKVSIGKPSIPRPEIDILAMKVGTNEILAIEAKSYFDSPGVKPEHLDANYDFPQGRYKLFTCTNYRDIVLTQLLKDLSEAGMATPDTNIVLGLAVGKVYRQQSAILADIMQKRQWRFWSPEMIKASVVKLADSGYTNDATTITAKILMR
mgnify:CR=1 FL=1